jgi:signal transduction histidine kinase
MVGKPVAEIIDDPLFSNPSRFKGLIHLGRIYNYELNYSKDGPNDERYISLSASVTRDREGEPVAVVCIGRDITERKRAEQQVRRQNEYLAALYETSLGLMNRLDLSSLLEAVIVRAAALVGTEHGYIYVVEPGEEEMTVQAGIGVFAGTLGMKIKRGEGLAGRVWQSDQPLVVDDYSTWQGRSSAFEELRFRAVAGVPLKSGQQVAGVLGLSFLDPSHRFGQAELDLLSRFAQLASIALDNARLYSAAQKEIAERTRAEQEVKRLNEDLEQRVIQRTEQLEAANKELEAFSYSVSHDLRAPLRAVMGFSNAMLEDYSETLEEPARRYLGLINDNTQNMGQLIDDLLAFSRLGRQQMEPVRVDMAALAHAVVEEIVQANTGRNIEVSVGDIPPAFGDRAMFRQVFVNLLSNAVKYTRGRDVACIEIGSEQRGGDNIYFVKDNGAGFDMKYAHKLFGVFQRLHSAREFEGTGVGLALVQRVVNRHGGRVWAEGKVGDGATFYFSLPVKGGNVDGRTGS